MSTEWFSSWFNSPYYHLLYNKHDATEAEFFINNLLTVLTPEHAAPLLDIACGRGRHSVYLSEQGFVLTGIDLSIENIRFAKQFENNGLQFFVHDMRCLFYEGCFDIAFNLFTSFGYFETDVEHINALRSFHKALKPGGLLVLDFFNSKKVIKNLVAAELKKVDNIDFRIQKTLTDNKIVKNITFADNGISYNFKEVVNAFSADDFKRFFIQSGFEIIATFGDYRLEEFDVAKSDRLIFICKKTDASTFDTA